MKPATARKQQKEETRRELYKLALQAFRKDGVEKASVDAIVKAAGVSRGTFYFHYPTKEHVIEELLQHSKERVAEKLDELPGTANAAMIIDTTVYAMVEQWKDDPRLFLEAGLLGLRRAGSEIDTRESDPVRRILALRFTGARKELRSKLPPEMLADVFLLDLLAAGLAWAGNPRDLDLGFVLQSASYLFLNGVRR